MSEQMWEETGEEWDPVEYQPEFDAYECACEHDANDHGWGGCLAPDCDCEAAWVE